MSDMSAVIIPKSDQWNADDFQAGPITFTIRAVRVKGGHEQPVEITVDGSNKFYRPCKSMARVMVSAWGADSSKYVGRSLTLYCDPKVKWGGMEVGGIRISHMSHIDSSITMALTVTRANKRPFTVTPIVAGAPKAAATSPSVASSDSPKGADESSAAPTITVDQAIELGDLFRERKWNKDKFFAKHGITSFEQVTVAQYEQAKAAA